MSQEESSTRTPPHDIQAEMGVLGSMLLSKEAVYVAREKLAQESFYKLAHQEIFDAITHVFEERDTVDLILVRDELKKREKLDKVGGVAYVAELMESVPTSANIEYYTEIVREQGIRRQLINTAADIQKNCYRDGQDVGDLLDRAEKNILSVRSEKNTSGASDMNDVLKRLVERLEEAHQNPGQITGIPTGFYDLDEITAGLQDGEFIVIAARPSVGKTSLGLNILHHVCQVERRPAVLYTLEMGAEQIVSNLLCIHNRLDSQDFRRGTLEDRQWKELESSLDELVGMPLYIDDSPGLGVMDVRARARRMMHQHDIELVVVDYLQLLETTRRYDNRATEVAAISQGLKALARELEIPVVSIAQLNRNVETEQRRPRMSDLRESGAIEQDADVIMLLHRPEQLDEGDEFEVPGSRAEVIVAKQRNGPTGQCPLAFVKRCLRFESMASQEKV